MTKTLGRGPLGSLVADVRHDVRRLLMRNAVYRRARYPFLRRFLLSRIANRSFPTMLCIYISLLLLALFAEWQIGRLGHPLLALGYYGDPIKAYLKDIASYLIATQAGILAIVSVAVAVVTLLSQRDDGASDNTDVRLYYVESYSYELAVSSVALLIVLVLQLFWPLQHILHAFGLGTSDLTFKIGLTFLHALWLCLNLLLFYEFIITTLSFVEPRARTTLRERYSASEIIPRDVEHRVLRANYINAPEQLFGKDGLHEGPAVTFGHGLGTDEGAIVEVSSSFERRMRVNDVWIRPLAFVLRRWRRRVQRAVRGKAKMARSENQISILVDFDRALEGQRDWVLRSGPVPLRGWERFVIRHSFRFAVAIDEEMSFPTPANFIEQLINKVVIQIAQSAQTGFESALTELVRYHGFVLAVQNVRDDSDTVINLAEIGGFLSQPDADWVREYRRVYVAAADKLTTDIFFMRRLGNLSLRLLPVDAPNFKPSVVQTLLDLGRHEVVVLEAWVTRRAVLAATDPTAGRALGGSDKSAYEGVLVDFVGAWEGLEGLLISYFAKLSRGKSNPASRWEANARSWPILQTHLYHTAYFLGAAVWNDDEIGAERYRDLLLRWLHPFYNEVRDEYRFTASALLTPDVMTSRWLDAEALGRRLMRFDGEPLAPGSLFGMMLREVHNDVVGLAATSCLSWYVTQRQPSETAVRAARALLRREKLANEGTDLTAYPSSPVKSACRTAFDLLFRYALTPAFGTTNYSSEINGLLNSLMSMATPRMVPNRIYGGYIVEGFEALRPQLLAILTTTLTDAETHAIEAFLNKLITSEPRFAEDLLLRNLIWAFTTYSNALNAPAVEFERSVQALSPELDADACRARGQALFQSLIACLEIERAKRLRAAPLDAAKMDVIRQALTDAILAHGADITIFRNVAITRDILNAIPTQERTFKEVDRGAFISPAMSGLNFNEFIDLIPNIARQFLAQCIWEDFSKRPKRKVTLTLGDDPSELWRAILPDALTVGPEPLLLIPNTELAQQISGRAYGLGGLDGLSFLREHDIPSGGGTGYLGTLEGVRVYVTNIDPHTLVLSSARLLLALRYGAVGNAGYVADFEFVEGDNPEKSSVRLTFAQATEWSTDTCVEYELSPTTPEDAAKSVAREAPESGEATIE